MGGCQRDIRIHERYNSATVDVASCPRSDCMAMVVSNGGDGLFRWSSGPDHIKPTLGPWCGENGVVSRGRAPRRCASAWDAENRKAFLYDVKECITQVSNRVLSVLALCLWWNPVREPRATAFVVCPVLFGRRARALCASEDVG